MLVTFELDLTLLDEIDTLENNLSFLEKLNYHFFGYHVVPVIKRIPNSDTGQLSCINLDTSYIELYDIMIKAVSSSGYWTLGDLKKNTFRILAEPLWFGYKFMNLLVTDPYGKKHIMLRNNSSVTREKCC